MTTSNMKQRVDLTNIDFLSGSRSWWQHVKTAKEATHFTHKYFTSGDYTGCAVETANRNVILSDAKLCKRLGIELLTESYSTETLLFPIASLNDNELIEIIERLERYPLLDDDELSEVERNLEIECFESFGARDFKEFLRVSDLITEEQYDDMTYGQLSAIYWKAAQNTNYNIFQVDCGTGGYFDFKSFGGLYEKSVPMLKPIIAEVLR